MYAESFTTIINIYFFFQLFFSLFFFFFGFLYFIFIFHRQRIEFLDTRTRERGQIPITTASRKLYGLTVAPEQCPPGGNMCQYRNGNCEPDRLCLPDGRGSRSCAPAETNSPNDYFNLI